MRKAGDLQELRGREHRHEHRWNTAAVLVSEYHLRALFRGAEILDRSVGSTAEVTENQFSMQRINSLGHELFLDRFCRENS